MAGRTDHKRGQKKLAKMRQLNARTNTSNVSKPAEIRPASPSSIASGYSLYSTDTDDPVASTHRGLDRCAALLANMMDLDGVEKVPTKLQRHGATGQGSKISEATRTHHVPRTQGSQQAVKGKLKKSQKPVVQKKNVPAGIAKGNKMTSKGKPAFNQQIISSTPNHPSKEGNPDQKRNKKPMQARASSKDKTNKNPVVLQEKQVSSSYSQDVRIPMRISPGKENVAALRQRNLKRQDENVARGRKFVETYDVNPQVLNEHGARRTRVNPDIVRCPSYGQPVSQVYQQQTNGQVRNQFCQERADVAVNRHSLWPQLEGPSVGAPLPLHQPSGDQARRPQAVLRHPQSALTAHQQHQHTNVNQTHQRHSDGHASELSAVGHYVPDGHLLPGGIAPADDRIARSGSLDPQPWISPLQQDMLPSLPETQQSLQTREGQSYRGVQDSQVDQSGGKTAQSILQDVSFGQRGEKTTQSILRDLVGKLQEMNRSQQQSTLLSITPAEYSHPESGVNVTRPDNAQQHMTEPPCSDHRGVNRTQQYTTNPSLHPVDNYDGHPQPGSGVAHPDKAEELRTDPLYSDHRGANRTNQHSTHQSIPPTHNYGRHSHPGGIVTHTDNGHPQRTDPLYSDQGVAYGNLAEHVPVRDTGQSHDLQATNQGPSPGGVITQMQRMSEQLVTKESGPDVINTERSTGNSASPIQQQPHPEVKGQVQTPPSTSCLPAVTSSKGSNALWDQVRSLKYLAKELRSTLSNSGDLRTSELLSELDEVIETLPFTSLDRDVQTEINLALQPMRSENSQLRRRLRIANQQIRQMELQAKGKGEGQSEASLEVLTLQSLNVNLQKQLDEVQKGSDDLQKDVTELRAANKSLTTDKHNLQEIFKKMDTDIKRRRQEWTAETGSLRQEVTKLKSQLESEHLKLESEEREKDILKLSVEQREKEIKRLQEMTRNMQGIISSVVPDQSLQSSIPSENRVDRLENWLKQHSPSLPQNDRVELAGPDLQSALRKDCDRRLDSSIMISSNASTPIKLSYPESQGHGVLQNRGNQSVFARSGLWMRKHLEENTRSTQAFKTRENIPGDYSFTQGDLGAHAFLGSDPEAFHNYSNLRNDHSLTEGDFQVTKKRKSSDVELTHERKQFPDRDDDLDSTLTGLTVEGDATTYLSFPSRDIGNQRTYAKLSGVNPSSLRTRSNQEPSSSHVDGPAADLIEQDTDRMPSWKQNDTAHRRTSSGNVKISCLALNKHETYRSISPVIDQRGQISNSKIGYFGREVANAAEVGSVISESTISSIATQYEAQFQVGLSKLDSDIAKLQLNLKGFVKR